jgi:hypothetical protein
MATNTKLLGIRHGHGPVKRPHVQDSGNEEEDSNESKRNGRRTDYRPPEPPEDIRAIVHGAMSGPALLKLLDIETDYIDILHIVPQSKICA